MPLQGGEVVRMSELLSYQEGSVVSRQLVKNASGGVTFFAFDAGEGLSEHTTPHDAFIVVTDGRAEIALQGESHTVAAGEGILLPGGQPHAVKALERFSMLLVMLRNG